MRRSKLDRRGIFKGFTRLLLGVETTLERRWWGRGRRSGVHEPARLPYLARIRFLLTYLCLFLICPFCHLHGHYCTGSTELGEFCGRREVRHLHEWAKRADMAPNQSDDSEMETGKLHAREGAKGEGACAFFVPVIPGFRYELVRRFDGAEARTRMGK